MLLDSGKTVNPSLFYSTTRALDLALAQYFLRFLGGPLIGGFGLSPGFM